MKFFLLGDQTKHMHIQDAFHPDGISYESGDEYEETENDLRLSGEKLDGSNSSSPKDQLGNNYTKNILKYSNSFFC
jgi:hypothetical protein